MLIFPLFRFNAPHEAGISIIAQGPEVTGNPDVTVQFKKSSGAPVNLVVSSKRVKGDVMYIHAKPGMPVAAAAFALAPEDAGVGTITVTITGTGDAITAQIGYGDPSIG